MIHVYRPMYTFVRQRLGTVANAKLALKWAKDYLHEKGDEHIYLQDLIDNRIESKGTAQPSVPQTWAPFSYKPQPGVPVSKDPVTGLAGLPANVAQPASLPSLAALASQFPINPHQVATGPPSYSLPPPYSMPTHPFPQTPVPASIAAPLLAQPQQGTAQLQQQVPFPALAPQVPQLPQAQVAQYQPVFQYEGEPVGDFMRRFLAAN
jgi:hypothetical protein